jgi:hypothetical protein
VAQHATAIAAIESVGQHQPARNTAFTLCTLFGYALTPILNRVIHERWSGP